PILQDEIEKSHSHEISSVSQIKARLKSECERLKSIASDEINRLKKEGRSTSKMEVLLENVREQEAKLNRVGQSDCETDRAVMKVVEIILKQLAAEIGKGIPNDHHLTRDQLKSLVERLKQAVLREIGRVKSNGKVELVKNLENLI